MLHCAVEFMFGEWTGGYKAMADSTPPTGGSQTPASLLKKGRSSLLWWGYLANYVMLGGAALVIVSVILEGEGRWWLKLGLPVVFISMAIVNLSVMHRRERKRAEQDAALGRGGT